MPNQLGNSSTYNDVAKCRGLKNVDIRGWFFSFNTGLDSYLRPACPDYKRRAVIDVNDIDQLTIHGFNFNGGTVSPASGALAAPQAFINANVVASTSGTGVAMSAPIDALIKSLGTVQMLNLPINASSFYFTLDEPVVWNGRIVTRSFYQPGSYNYSVLAKGDCLEYYGTQGVFGVPCGSSGQGVAEPTLGVMMQDGLPMSTQAKYTYLPIATGGFVVVNFGWGPYSINTMVRPSTAIRRVALVAGSGGKQGTYSWTAAGGGCSDEPNGTITVANGSIAQVSLSDVGRNCTNLPSIARPSTTGFVGASLTPIWPSGMFTEAQSLADQPFVGVSGAGYSGSSSAGNLQNLIHLMGLQ